MQQCLLNIFSSTVIKVSTTTLVFIVLSEVLLCIFCLFSAGDVGILSLFNAGSLQWMLPAGCRGFLLLAHRDERPWLTGVQPQRMGTGDGWERISLAGGHQVKLRIAGMTGYESNEQREQDLLDKNSNPEA